jgi:hypothetical protein
MMLVNIGLRKLDAINSSTVDLSRNQSIYYLLKTWVL